MSLLTMPHPHRHRPYQADAAPSVEPDPAAKAAVRRAEGAIERNRSRVAVAERLADEIAERNAANHFADRLRAIMQPKPHPA